MEGFWDPITLFFIITSAIGLFETIYSTYKALKEDRSPEDKGKVLLIENVSNGQIKLWKIIPVIAVATLFASIGGIFYNNLPPYYLSENNNSLKDTTLNGKDLPLFEHEVIQSPPQGNEAIESNNKKIISNIYLFGIIMNISLIFILILFGIFLHNETSKSNR